MKLWQKNHYQLYPILGGFQLEFVSISWAINHMTCYKFECSHWWKIIFFENNQPMRGIEFITVHVIFKLCYIKSNLPTEKHRSPKQKSLYGAL